ncbi:MAG: acyltransferase [Candidatus Zixiibacteriota bacterium]|nr:MAG: acyltransferase [candidate division Zixibacteria bacterium]
MIRILKLFWWSIRRKPGRFAVWQFLVKDIPGEYGVEIRRRIYRRFLGRTGNNIVVHPDVRIVGGDKLFVGDDVHLGVGNMLQASGEIELGDRVVLGPGVKIWSINHKFDDPTKHIMEQGYEYKKVVIEEDCWIGSNVFIMPGARIGRGTIVSAGAVVGAKPVSPYKILAGNPARVIGSRVEQPLDDSPSPPPSSPPSTPDD